MASNCINYCWNTNQLKYWEANAKYDPKFQIKEYSPKAYYCYSQLMCGERKNICE